jgi:hypothetical protein
MSRLFDLAGVDYDQWRALVRAALKVDFRTSVRARSGRHRDVKAASALLGQLIFYSAMGGLIAAVVWFAADLFVASLVVVTYIMFMVGTVALLDHNSAIASPDDYLILGWRPVSSRTYFAARVTNALVYILALTTAFAYLPLVSFAIRHGAAIGGGAVAAVYAASLATALAMIALYAAIVRVVGAARLKRILSYVQMMASFVVYGGYFLVAQLVGQEMMIASIDKQPWMIAMPPVWFASIVELAAGRRTPLEIASVAAGAIVLAGLGRALGGRLSLDYAARLGAAMSSGQAAPAPARPPRARRAFWFRGGEARAAALLIRGQFRNDLKFRMGVLAILPLTIVYVLMAVMDGGLGDPFVRPRGSGFGFVTMAIMMFPTMLRVNLVRSDAFRASWIFFAAPVDRARLVRASKDLLVVTFLLPYLLLVGAVLSYFSPSIPHVAVHLLVVGLLSHLVLQVVILVEPELPFSKPLVKGAASSRVFVVMFAVGATAVALPALGPVIYGSAAATTVAVALLVAIGVLLDRLTRVRIARLTAGLEFEG